MNKLFAIIALPLLLLAGLSGCGGGGDGGSGGSSGSSSAVAGASGTAAQYFNKNAVGNTWTTLDVSTLMVPRQPTLTSTLTGTSTISSFVNGVVSYVDTTISPLPNVTYYPSTYTAQLDATGAMVTTHGPNTYLELPANFSVGTTWIYAPADPAAGYSAVIATIAAFDVTRTVPAGTFTDCLQINATVSSTDQGVTTTGSLTIYLSPTAGSAVESSGSSSSSDGSSETFTSLLQPNYIANP